jgi:hypothetical protein
MTKGFLWFIIIAFIAVGVLSSLIKHLLNRNWTLVYTAFGNENYLKIAAKLQEDGVPYKTETPADFRTPRNGFNDQTQYDIYVKKTDEHKSAHALRK